MAPRKVQLEKQSKLDQFFGKTSNNATKCNNPNPKSYNKDNNNSNNNEMKNNSLKNDNDHHIDTDDEDEDEDLKISLSELVGQKRHRSCPEIIDVIPINKNRKDEMSGTSCRLPVVSSNEIIRQAMVPSVRRYFSHANMDFIPIAPKKLSFHDYLLQRSHTGCRLATAGTLTMTSLPKNWKSTRWVELTPLATPIECMAWDTLGVLLSVAESRTIRVYDWDTVRAAEIAGKAEWQRQLQSLYQIPPLLQFPVPHAVSYLQWNPNNPDQLAVGFKVQGFIHIYQLDLVVAWQEKQAKRISHSSSRYPPSNCFSILQPSPPSNGTVSSIVFYNQSILVSMGSSVYCWDNGKLQWRYQPSSSSSPCTCITPLSKSWILLATQQGQFIIVDSHKTERAAFSLQDKPIVIHEWTSQAQPVLDCQVVTVVDHYYFHLMWVTSTGWVYQTKITVHNDISSSISLPLSSTTASNARNGVAASGRRRGLVTTKLRLSAATTPSFTISISSPTVVYSPPKIAIYNAQNEHIGDDQYSVPSQPMISNHTKNCWVWSEVPKMSKYLGHHDKYVVDRLKIVRESERALLLHSQGKLVRIPVPKQPQVVALHPDLEWMVMGVDKELLILANRS